MKKAELERVSRWLEVYEMPVTRNHRLWDYADKDDDVHGWVTVFRYKKRLYALDQFLARYGICGFDKECERYPEFIVGYDAEELYYPLLLELDASGERCRLWREVPAIWQGGA